MAGKGAPPNEDSIRSKDHKDIVERTKVGKSKAVRGFDLPESFTWHSQTVAWWANWRISPLTEIFGTTDWDFLLETAVLHTALWTGNNSVASELRLRVAKFGATPEDRQRLRLDITNPELDSDVPVSKTSSKPSKKTSDRRSRLSVVPPITA